MEQRAFDPPINRLLRIRKLFTSLPSCVSLISLKRLFQRRSYWDLKIQTILEKPPWNILVLSLGLSPLPDKCSDMKQDSSAVVKAIDRLRKTVRNTGIGISILLLMSLISQPNRFAPIQFSYNRLFESAVIATGVVLTILLISNALRWMFSYDKMTENSQGTSKEDSHLKSSGSQIWVRNNRWGLSPYSITISFSEWLWLWLLWVGRHLRGADCEGAHIKLIRPKHPSIHHRR